MELWFLYRRERIVTGARYCNAEAPAAAFIKPEIEKRKAAAPFPGERFRLGEQPGDGLPGLADRAGETRQGGREGELPRAVG